MKILVNQNKIPEEGLCHGGSVSYFNYDALMEESFRSVVKTILEDVAEKGLIDDHHFYITYKTNFPGVALPSYLLEKYPDEITLLLQYEFWNLQVNQDSFEVTLNFNEQLENLVVPFASLINFFDPSTRFGLQFTPVVPAKIKKMKKTNAKSSIDEKDLPQNDEKSEKNNVIAFDFSKKK